MSNFNKLLQKYENESLLKSQQHPTLPLKIWNYTEKTQYNKLWDNVTLKHRATIRDLDGNLIANSFSKFFNIEEGKHIESKNFKIYEKMDGSFGMLFYYQNQWIFCSKGSFTSEQAIKGFEILQNYQYQDLPTQYSYIFEIIYPENRIVVNYGEKKELVLLAVFDIDGKEYDISLYNTIFPVVKTYNITNYQELKQVQQDNFEGFVIKFDNGTRCKVKLEKYLELHRALSNISKYKVWEYLSQKQSIQELIEVVPDEFHSQINNWYNEIATAFTSIECKIKEYFEALPIFNTRKELALYIKDYQYKSIIFTLYDNQGISDKIYKLIEPETKECLMFYKN
jgi:RNA ligase